MKKFLDTSLDKIEWHAMIDRAGYSNHSKLIVEYKLNSHWVSRKGRTGATKWYGGANSAKTWPIMVRYQVERASEGDARDSNNQLFAQTIDRGKWPDICFWWHHHVSSMTNTIANEVAYERSLATSIRVLCYSMVELSPRRYRIKISANNTVRYL